MPLSTSAFWLPQVDWGGANQRLAETDPPLYSAGRWPGSMGFRRAGMAGPRPSLVFSLLALWLVVRLGRQLLGLEAGWWGAGAASAVGVLRTPFNPKSLLLCLRRAGPRAWIGLAPQRALP